MTSETIIPKKRKLNLYVTEITAQRMDAVDEKYGRGTRTRLVEHGIKLALEQLSVEGIVSLFPEQD
jgi:hypothetical protein